ncbi:MAG: YlxR family protein [Lachnospiraceae bacterium]|nr:YlxR family protein [Lachnospiraceae bacterium]
MTGVKKVPLRKCTGCGQMKNKKELVRVIRTPEEEILIDTTGRKNGRGAYLCNSPECLGKAKKSKGLERSLKVPIPTQVYEALEGRLREMNGD